MGVKNVHESWPQKDPLKAYPELPKVMSLRLFNGLKKHFRVSIADDLPDRDSEDYHPLQNVLWALDFLREAQKNWIPGKVFALDEDRVKSKSRRNAFKSRNPGKPIKGGQFRNLGTREKRMAHTF